MNEKEKMLAGKIYDPSDEELTQMRLKAHKLCQSFNSLFEDDKQRKALLDELIPNQGERLFLQGPIYFDYGINTSFGSDCFANFNFTVLDICPVTIGDNVFFGPNCTIASPVHALMWQERNIFPIISKTRFIMNTAITSLRIPRRSTGRRLRASKIRFNSL